MNVAVTGINFLRQAEIAGRLRRLLPADAVLHAEEDTRAYECDGLSAYRQLPMVVALPSGEDEVREVLRACHELKVPVVARGAGTGLSGGALPRGDGVLLSLARMRRIRASDSSTPSPRGSAPPESPVPAPRAVTGTFSSWQARSTSRT